MTGMTRVTGRWACAATAIFVCLVGLVLVGSMSLPARAETAQARADQMVREGAALGEAGHWDAAIERFRAAEALFPRAIHDCNIGLAYARSKRPHLGWLHLGMCQARSDEALPSWVESRRREAETQMTRGDFARVEISVGDGGVAGAEVVVESLAGAVVRPPVEVWLPLGEHRFSATAPEHLPKAGRLTVGSRERVSLVLSFVPEPTRPDVPVEPDVVPPVEPDVVPPEPSPITPPDEAPSASRTGAWVAFGVGLAAVAAGGVLYAVAADTSDEANRLPPGETFDETLAAFERERAFSYGLLGAGAVSAGVGLVLLLLPEDMPKATVTPLAGGGLFSFSKQF